MDLAASSAAEVRRNIFWINLLNIGINIIPKVLAATISKVCSKGVLVAFAYIMDSSKHFGVWEIAVCKLLAPKV